MFRRKWVLLTCFVLFLVAPGCASRRKASDDMRAMYVTQHPEMDARFASAVLAGNVLLGMNKEMVQAAWGEPTRIEKLIENSKGEERWTFGNYLVNSAVTHLYFRNNEAVLYEFVDTQTQATQSISDTNERLSFLAPPSGKGSSGRGP